MSDEQGKPTTHDADKALEAPPAMAPAPAPAPVSTTMAGLDVPSMETITGGKPLTTYDTLSPDARERVDRAVAQPLDISNQLALTDIGRSQQEDLVDVAAQVVAAAKGIAVGPAKEMAQDLRRKYEELDIGSLRQPKGLLGLLARFGGDRLTSFIERQESIDKAVDAIFKAQADVEAGLRTEYGKVQTNQGRNVQAVEDLKFEIAVVEQRLVQMRQEAVALAEQLKGTQDPNEIQRLREMISALQVLGYHVNALRVSQLEAANSAGIMNVQCDGIVKLVGMIAAGRTTMKQAWLNQIGMAITNHKMGQAIQMIQEDRGFRERIMTANVDDLAQVSMAIAQELGTGVVSIPVLEALAERSIQLQESVVEAATEIEQKQAEYGDSVNALTAKVQAAQADSTAMVAQITGRSESDPSSNLPGQTG